MWIDFINTYAALTLLARERGIRKPIGCRNSLPEWRADPVREECRFCRLDSVRSSSEAFYEHCKTAEHISARYSVDEELMVEEYDKHVNLTRNQLRRLLSCYHDILKKDWEEFTN